MPQFDVSKELTTFYDTHVRLGKTKRDELAGYRDTNLKRVNDGLDALAAQRKTTYAHYAEFRNQGSYAMHTLNQCEHDDYDIDVALVFNAGDLPDDAAEARLLVRDALRKATESLNFSKLPEARDNAVTIWYADGYHVDFAVYRLKKTFAGNVYEHAGANGWAARNPDDLTEWFAKKVAALSPSNAVVADAQLRRIVRFVKRFAKSRSGWALPGGMIISALVCEVYKPSSVRDDIALYDTLIALRNRLAVNKTVQSPVEPYGNLIDNDEKREQIERLYEYLDREVKKLEVLQATSCTHEQAMKAWGAIFWHEFWDTAAKAEAAARGLVVSPMTQVECALARYQGGPVVDYYRSGAEPLPKGLGIRFRVTNTAVPAPYQVRWTCLNEGDEARSAGQLKWSKTLAANEPLWTSTAFRGRHLMRCEIIKDGQVWASNDHLVRITGRR